MEINSRQSALVSCTVFYPIQFCISVSAGFVPFVGHFRTYPSEHTDSRGRLINYANVTWAQQHYREFNGLKSDYNNFIGWRRKPFQGETITIVGRYAQRLTMNDAS